MCPPSDRADEFALEASARAPATKVAGWDIGGAHLKCTLVDAGRIVDAFQIDAPLWQGLQSLEAAFDIALARIGSVALHAITMTGELSDLFEDRQHGVRELVELAAARLSPLLVYAGRSGLLAATDAIAAGADVASANWHATATIVGRRVADALLVDIGSTTADLVPVASHRVCAKGYTDAERLATGELLYSGATRTPVMAVCSRVPFAGTWRTLMAEHFATMADVRRLTGDLATDEGPAGTADGRGTSLPECRARLARMIGWDAESAPSEVWDALARYVGEHQLVQLFDNASLVLSRSEIGADAPVVGAGSGRYMARRLANRLGRPYLEFGTLVGPKAAIDAAASDAAPACAVALIAADHVAAAPS
jgi:(4-(4-[2-(gamma-L-glutamylamino)ethyl]phenoxymethyl)furan-2-yl)methanamine synthase